MIHYKDAELHLVPDTLHHWPLMYGVDIQGRRCGYLGQTTKEMKADPGSWDSISASGWILGRYPTLEQAFEALEQTKLTQEVRQSYDSR